MNKLHEISERTLINNEEYLKRLEDVKRKLDEQLQQEFSLNRHNSEQVVEKRVVAIEKFNSHPRNCSFDTTPSISPRNISSFDLSEKLKSEHAKKRTFKKWTSVTRARSVPQRIDADIGDTFENSFVSTKADDFKARLNMFDSKIALSASNLQQPSQNQSQKECLTKDLSDDVFEKKFKIFIEKSVKSIGDICHIIDKGIDPPDGDVDVSRRKLRVTEFSNRFSRNYLYPLVRQIDELSKLKAMQQGFNQKFLSAYQVIYNGLHAYQNHLPTSIGACSSDKLKMLMKHLLDICDIHYKVLPEDDERNYKDFIITFRRNAEMILKTIDDHFTVNNYRMPTQIRLNSVPKMTKPKKSKNTIPERLYMYNSTTFRKEPRWKLAADALNQGKSKQIKSRYKTAGFKHRPPIVRKSENASAHELQPKLGAKKLYKKPSTYAALNDEDVATMIQMEGEKIGTDANEDEEKRDENKKGEQVNIVEIVQKLLQLVVDINARKKDNDSEENIKRDRDVEKIMGMLEKLNKNPGIESMNDLLKELQSDTSCKEILELKIVDSGENVRNAGNERKTSPIFCSEVRQGKEALKRNSPAEADNFAELERGCRVKTAHHQGDGEKETGKAAQKPSTSLNVRKTSKTSRCLLPMLPKQYAINIIQYKLDFGKYSKSIPVYKKTTKILPWVLISNLSEKILNLILRNVTKDIEISEVVENIYQSELQFC
ncbi:unnamed protein product [Phyllotreta striolata]|uniref:Uncharacterized protein n=1 Tax=Phyllotreta striolata TaxID=444603 RepID=A0A9N9TVT6_PHYSR|nr:unnamed protein product [Phyllotreta striolata]